MYLVSCHGRLKRVDGIDLCDDNATSESSKTLRRSLTHVSISSYYAYFTGNHYIGCSLDTIYQRFPASVQIVEFTL